MRKRYEYRERNACLSLTNTQYDELMRSYSRDRAAQVRLLEARRKHIYDTVPDLRELDAQIASSAVSSAISRLDGQNTAAAQGRSRMHALMQQRRDLLSENGFSQDALEIGYTCPDCRDTGYIGDRKCHCFYRRAVDLFYTQSGLRSALEKENFTTFSFDWYDDRRKNPATGLSPRQNMHRIVRTVRDFIEHFDEAGGGNLLFYGGTGLGKTFLSNCLAKELIESAHSVLYYSSQDLFDAISGSTFGSGARDPFTDCLMDTDLLIIDDLGTEMTNSFTSSKLFHILNQRISRKKSMVISTNLNLSDFADVYSERIFSRISSSFILLGFYGDDIRILRKLRK